MPERLSSISRRVEQLHMPLTDVQLVPLRLSVEHTDGILSALMFTPYVALRQLRDSSISIMSWRTRVSIAIPSLKDRSPFHTDRTVWTASAHLLMSRFISA